MKNVKINEALEKYTAGQATLEETNETLAGSGFYLEPEKNALTEAEKRASTVGCHPVQTNGWGLLDSGTGSLDKAEGHAGQLVSCDMGESHAMYIIAGRTYVVQGTALVGKAEKAAQRSAQAGGDCVD